MADQMFTGNIASFLTPEGALVFTLTNNGYKRMTYNLATHLLKIKVPWKLCIVCTDSQSFRYLRGMNIPCIRLREPLPDFGADPSPFGSKYFQTLNLKKLELLAKFSSDPSILHGVYLDGDIAVYSDFLPDTLYRLKAPGAPKLMLQCDEQTRVDCSGNLGGAHSCINGCTGFVAWSHGVDTRVFSVNAEKGVWKSHPEDQLFVNTMMQRLNIPVATVPRHLYPNGAFATLYGKESPLKKVAHLLHYNYLIGASKEKKMMLNGDWIIAC